MLPTEVHMPTYFLPFWVYNFKYQYKVDNPVSSTFVIGNHGPSLLIFPRVNLKDRLLSGALPEATGPATLSGWTNKSVFNHWFDHFLFYTLPCSERPVLFLIDDHESHLVSCDNRECSRYKKGQGEFCDDSNLTPNSSNKLKPLDLSTRPFEELLRRSSPEFLTKNTSHLRIKLTSTGDFGFCSEGRRDPTKRDHQ
ncbi:hypothetical protein QYM36_007495 [Artemia franciscana]|uniref:DDE-1 domain-containing protein n=1 Tax=Artemia franciscana TaxID=6661 RepID=A0AA88ITZ5_ARTSF|nr:hypothetical protein QYM36_007495 [Artemia franciscana]